MTDKLSNIQGIIWDLDDTLYSVTDELKLSMRGSMARAVIRMGYDISYEDALKMAEDSQEKYRMTYKLLSDHFSIPKRDLHIPFHEEMDHSVTQACPDLPSAFAAKPNIKHVLMTHASRNWAMRMLNHLGIADFFDSKHVLGLEDLDFNHKDESDYVAKACLDLLGTDVDKTAFAEDRDYNLIYPHQMGMTTVLINHPSQPVELPPHVDYRFDNAKTFLMNVAS